MQPQQPTSAQEPIIPRGAARPSIVVLLVGIAVGVGIGPAAALFFTWAEAKSDDVLSFAVGVFVSLGLSIVMLAFGAFFWLPRLIRHFEGNLHTVATNLTDAGRAYSASDNDAALKHVSVAAQQMVGWYSTMASRRFIVQSSVALLIAFGGVISALLLLSQNGLLRSQNTMLGKQLVVMDEQYKLLKDQNNKIDIQTMTADAQKRAAFSTELFSILAEVSKVNKREISQDIINRIVVLTTSATPYMYIDFTTLRANERNETSIAPIRRPLSPERGQLLAALLRMDVNIRAVIDSGADFQYADFGGLDLTGQTFADINLSYSSFRHAKLNGARFSNVLMADGDFTRADAREAQFQRLYAEGAVFLGAKLDEARFELAYLHRADFSDSSLVQASFELLSCSRCAFNGTRIARRANTNRPTGLQKIPAGYEACSAHEGVFLREVLTKKNTPEDASVKPCDPPGPPGDSSGN